MELTDRKPQPLPAAVPPRPGVSRAGIAVRPLLAILLLSLVVGIMAYQAPPAGRVAVGWLGDRLFLSTSPGLSQEAIDRGDLFADELAPDSPTARARWTRQHARIVLPNIGRGADLELTITAQGWPADALGVAVAQPTVTIQADGSPIGSFTPTNAWATYTLRIPASVRRNSDLTIDLFNSHTFTGTERFGPDPRPKGVRLAALDVRAAADDPTALYPPAWPAVVLLLLCAGLLFVLVHRLVRSIPAVYAITAVGVGAAGIGLAAMRIWMAAALSVALALLLVALAISWQGPALNYLRRLVRRYAEGPALSYGLIGVALVFLGYLLAELFVWFGSFGRPLFWQIFPDSLLYGLLAAGLIGLGLTLGRDGLPRLADNIVALIGSRRGALTLLALFGAVWLAYIGFINARLPYVGHADYSDNAVVARNLAAGRGWVVDYVTQFFTLRDGLTRPQETWPLLQPVWIVPFFALFGPTAWAAKLPNLIFSAILLVMIYAIGARIWDRRVGLTAALFTLTNYLFFRLAIYVTNDLAFVVFSMGAIYALYRSQESGVRNQESGDGRRRTTDSRRASPSPRHLVTPSPLRWLLLSGVLTGLMMLQKPSGAMIAVGMGLWLIVMQHAACTMQQYQRTALQRAVLIIGAWSVVALVVLSPYLVRNMLEFGKPVYSTESYDAWVLGYRGPSGDAWAEIYRVFTPELGGPGNPDRSWILRWGFDATFDKFMTQVRELRNYLMPIWPGLPSWPGQLFSQSDCSIPANCKNIVSVLGAWLALIGVIGAIRFRRRLIGLLALTFAPYIVFMLTYWRTDEERYWVMLIPWLALLAAWMVWAIYDKLAEIGDRRWAPLGLILAVAMIAIVTGYSRPDITNKVVNEPGPTVWAPDLAAYAWLDANIPADAAVMTRIPWQLNWHTERPAVMIPNTGDMDMLLTIARHYGAEYLVLENQLRVKGDAGQLLSPLLRPGDAPVGTVIEGFTLVYASPTDDFRAFIYRFPE
jgi:4-amino-4-deoxy-L-arabinose transferase-like glycosyltransferase